MNMQPRQLLRTCILSGAALIAIAGSASFGHIDAEGVGTVRLSDQVDRAGVFGLSELAANHIREAIPGMIRSRSARVDVESLLLLDIGDTLELNLFDDEVYTGVVDRLDGRSFSGTINDQTGGSFVFVVNPEAIEGYVSIPGNMLYEISGTGEGEMQIDQVDALRLPGCAGGLTGGIDQGHVGHQGQVRHPASNSAASRSGGASEDGSQIDVLVAYTDDARQNMGGTNQILARIDLAIAASNRSYDNSNIGFQINLVHTVEFDYDENTSSYGTHLTRLREKNDGYIDEVHDLRDQYGADIVTMLVDDGRYCGIARLMTSLSPNFESSAFNIVTWFCAAGNLSFPHELGHNMGACHARGDGGGCLDGGLFDYSVGHRFGGTNDQRYRTVMAYSPGSRIEYFSNPDVSVDGDPTGVANDAENALTLNQSSLVISNFRLTQSICDVDLNGDGGLDFFDVSAFLTAFRNEDPVTDLNHDGSFDFFDVSAYWAAFVAGCP